jgi:hypothetical protein
MHGDRSARSKSVSEYSSSCIDMRADEVLISACAVNQPGYGGFIWTRSVSLTWLRLDNG